MNVGIWLFFDGQMSSGREQLSEARQAYAEALDILHGVGVTEFDGNLNGQIANVDAALK